MVFGCGGGSESLLKIEIVAPERERERERGG